MEIKSLEKTSFGTLFEAFGQAFADYEVQLDKTQLRRMLWFSAGMVPDAAASSLFQR